MCRFFMASISVWMAVKMFWNTSRVKPFLSASLYPLPWMILICLIKVLFPLSPVPGQTRRMKRKNEKWSGNQSDNTNKTSGTCTKNTSSEQQSVHKKAFGKKTATKNSSFTDFNYFAPKPQGGVCVFVWVNMCMFSLSACKLTTFHLFLCSCIYYIMGSIWISFTHMRL